MPKKLSRRELRRLIAEAGSFEAPAMDPLSTGEVMDMMRRGEDVAGVERLGRNATYDENRAKVDSMVKDAEREIVKIVEDLADIVGDRRATGALTSAVNSVIARREKMDALRKQGL